MIDFNLTDHDQKILDYVRTEALVARKYARYYDENEAEFPPEELDEAKDFPGVWGLMGDRGSDDSGASVIGMLVTMAENWGDYSVRMRKGRGVGLGNAALGASGTPEQREKWGGLLLSMAITEPGCGSDPSLVQTTAVLDEETDEWVINGEKIFVTTGCRSRRRRALGHPRPFGGPRGHQELPRREGDPGLPGLPQGEEARHPRRRHGHLRLHGLPSSRAATCSAARRRFRRRAPVVSAA